MINNLILVERPKFYGQYEYSVSMSLNLGDWHLYFDHKEELSDLINHNGIVSGSKLLLTYYVFTNATPIIDHIIDWASIQSIDIHSVKKIDPSFLHVELKRKKYLKKGNWYGMYPYRIRLKRMFFDFSDIKDKLSGKVHVSGNNPALIYFSHLNDVVLFKLLYSENIIEIHDAHTLRG